MNKNILILRTSTLSVTRFIPLFIGLSFFFTPQTVTAQITPAIQGFWNKIFKPARDPQPPIKPRKGGSRPRQSICLISPDVPSQTRIIWNTKPLFIWHNGEFQPSRGNQAIRQVKKIAVATLDSKLDSQTNSQRNNQKYLSTQIVAGKQSITYQGEPLKPGQTYTWLVFLTQEATAPTMFVNFKIMEANQRDRITIELKRLEQLQRQKGANPETIALEKTKYFADKGLWSDALQQAYSVPKPSSELAQLRQDLPKQLCYQ
jgi:Domain of Unknown Function (DUF928)